VIFFRGRSLERNEARLLGCLELDSRILHFDLQLCPLRNVIFHLFLHLKLTILPFQTWSAIGNGPVCVDQRGFHSEHGTLDDSWSCRSASHIRFIKATYKEVKKKLLKFYTLFFVFKLGLTRDL
jgi:hypothetical protein